MAVDKKEFSEMIERMAQEKGCGTMDAVVDYCTKNGMEIEVAAKLLNPKVKKAIEKEARGSKMLKPKGDR